MNVSLGQVSTKILNFMPRGIEQESGGMSIAIKQFGNVSKSFAERVEERAKDMKISFPNAEITANLRRASELGDVVELRGLHPDTEVAETVFTQRGYDDKVVGKSYCSNLSEFPKAVSDAYNGFLRVVSGGNWITCK